MKPRFASGNFLSTAWASTCAAECPGTHVAKRRNWVFSYGRMIGKKCELPLNSENKFTVAWGDPTKGGSNAPVISNMKTVFSGKDAFVALTNELVCDANSVLDLVFCDKYF